ncbi:MAG: hypothetical protein R2694_11525 [Ilumatobacteraceae bacterium]
MTFAVAAAYDNASLAGASQRGPIPDATVHAVAAMIDNTGAVAQIARWRDDDTHGSHPGGRPSALDDRAVLTVWVLLAIEHSPLFVDRAADLIANRLSPAALNSLGVRHHPSSVDDCYGRCWRATHRLLDVIDAYPAPRHRLLTAEDQAQVLAARDPATQQTKQRRADWLCNQLIDGTWALLPRETRRRWNGNTAVDATVVPIFNRPSTKRSLSTVDPDAAWYVREGDHRDPGDGQRKGKGRTIWGYEAHIAVATPNTPTALSDFPLLATGITFDKPGHNIAANALTIYQSMHHRGMPTALAAGDRAYWPNSHADKLQLPMRALGWTNINDYKDTELGVQAGHAGGIMVEGNWYCPSMPAELVEATIDYRVRKTIDESTWQQRITARTRYCSPPKNDPTATGTSRCAAPPSGRQRQSRARYAPPRSARQPKSPCGHASPHHPSTLTASARRPLCHSHRPPGRNTVKTCSSEQPHGPTRTPSPATLSKASTATSKTEPTKHSATPHAAACEDAPPNTSSPPCSSSPRTSARSAPSTPNKRHHNGPSADSQRRADANAKASPTTSPTPTPRPAPRPPQPHSPLTAFTWRAPTPATTPPSGRSLPQHDRRRRQGRKWQ